AARALLPDLRMHRAGEDGAGWTGFCRRRCGPQVGRRVLDEFLAASRRTEPVPAARMLRLVRGCGGYGHPAHRVAMRMGRFVRAGHGTSFTCVPRQTAA